MRRRIWLVSWLIAALAATSGDAQAAEPDRAPEIWGGQELGTCALPTVAWLPEVGCSAVLIAPEIVLTAAHCTQSMGQPTVVFGERVDAPALVRETLECVPNPAWTGLVDAADFGYCRLAQRVELPIVPVARGCELDELGPGSEVVLAGFGEDEQGESGRKRLVETTLASIDEGLISLGGDGKDSCLGDSGGPVLIESESGWRVAGLIVGGQACGAGGQAVLAEPALVLAEREAGLDLDPCRDGEGSWAPGAACGGFAEAPLEAVGEWSDGCAAAAVSGASSGCGPAHAPEVASGCVCASTPTRSGAGVVFPMLLVLLVLGSRLTRAGA